MVELCFFALSCVGGVNLDSEGCGLDGLVYCVDRIRSEVKAVAADAIMIMT